MNQIMRVGKGVVIAIEKPLPWDAVESFRAKWEEVFGANGVPIAILPDARIVESDGTILFEFTGDVSPTLVAEFQRWWEDVNRA